MRPTISFVTFLVLAALALIHSSEGSAEGTGALTWGQACSPSATLHDDQSSRCDTSKRLSCDVKSRTCKCHHGERDFYNSKADRCETKVGMFCSASETFPTICVNNADCQTSTNFCVCNEGAEANDDGTECIKEDDDDDANAATTISKQSLPFHVAITILTIVTGTWIL